MKRFLVTAETGGKTEMSVWNKRQEEVMKLYEDGNDNVYLEFSKPNSRVVIGGYSNYPNSLGHKLFVQGGSAKIEGNILTDANIGIGTQTFSYPESTGTVDYGLAVKGNVRAYMYKAITTGWSDFVFKKDYKLPSLATVEKHIEANGHLPNIPSEKEIVQVGIDLGEMAKLQMQKIEELTLYLIEQNKKIESMAKEIKDLKKTKK